MRFILFLLLLPVSVLVAAQPAADTIRPGNLDMKYLPRGKQNYLVYIVAKDGSKKSIWLWERSCRIEQWQGKDAVVVRQQWTSSDTGFNKRELWSVNDPKDFTAVYHFSNNPKTGIEAYHFTPASVFADDTVGGNTRKGFRIPLDEPSLNWELDLETFPLLPLQNGKSFLLNFYHPGSKTPASWYRYTVTGTEILPLPGGNQVECFKLFTDYGNNRGNSTWWISRQTHEVLKMEEHFGPVTRYKIRLSVGE